jgi:uncharacterized glyoxalase superfamily protein PhnB
MTDQIPEPQTVTAYLRVQGAEQAIDFYARVFGATEVMRLVEPGSRRIGHAELRIGNSVVMLADEFPEHDIRGPKSLGGTSVGLALHVDDVDDVTAAASRAGATIARPPKDEFYGERTAKIVDPFGHEWHLSAVIEQVSPEEMQRRYEKIVNAG